MNLITDQERALWRDATDEDAVAAIERSGQSLAGHIEALSTLLESVGAERLLLVADRGAMRAADIESIVAAQLAGIPSDVFDAFSPNPTSAQCEAAARAASRIRADAVVGIGGGSCLDVAKVAALAARTPRLLASLARGERIAEADPLPLIAVPSTSGTGSEATHFAAIYVDGKKASLAHPRMRPAAVILDRRLHEAMPPALAAVSGLDALAQALESLWAVGGDAESAAYAEPAGRLAAMALERSVLQGAPEARAAMMLSAHLAGQAINLSKTTAAHALSYALTQRHGIPHGHAAALMLGAVGRLNGSVAETDCQDPRGPAHVRRAVASASAILGATPETLPQAVAGLIKRLGLASSLREAGVPREALADLAGLVDPVRLGNNPRRMDAAGVLALLEEAWGPA